MSDTASVNSFAASWGSKQSRVRSVGGRSDMERGLSPRKIHRMRVVRMMQLADQKKRRRDAMIVVQNAVRCLQAKATVRKLRAQRILDTKAAYDAQEDVGDPTHDLDWLAFSSGCQVQTCVAAKSFEAHHLELSGKPGPHAQPPPTSTTLSPHPPYRQLSPCTLTQASYVKPRQCCTSIPPRSMGFNCTAT